MKTILTFFKGKSDNSYYFKVKNYGAKSYEWVSSLYTTEMHSWWKAKQELANLKNTGDGFIIKLVEGSAHDRKVKTLTLDYSQAEYLLILLLKERKQSGDVKFKELR